MTSEIRAKARALHSAQRTAPFDGVRGELPQGVPESLRIKFAAARDELLSHARRVARDMARQSRSARTAVHHALGERPAVRSPRPAAIERSAFRILRAWLEGCRGLQRSHGSYTRGEQFPPKLARLLKTMLDAYDFAVSADLADAEVRTGLSAAGGRAKARIVRAETAERDRQIHARARQLEREGRSRRELPGLLAPHFNLSARRIRDILKTA